MLYSWTMRTYEELVKLGISQEQAKRKADALPDGQSETTRAR